MQSFVKAFGFI